MSPVATAMVKDELNAQIQRLDAVAKEVHEIKDELHDLHDEFYDLKETLIKSVPLGDPNAHLQDHVQIAKDRAIREEERQEARKFRKDLIRKAQMALILAAVSLLWLGLAEKFKLLVGAVIDGKSASEIKAEASK